MIYGLVHKSMSSKRLISFHYKLNEIPISIENLSIIRKHKLIRGGKTIKFHGFALDKLPAPLN